MNVSVKKSGYVVIPPADLLRRQDRRLRGPAPVRKSAVLEPARWCSAMWSSKPVPTEQPMPPSLYECALGLKSCTGPSSMRVDQLTLLNTWPLFVLIGLVGAVVLWVLYSPSHSPPPPRRPPMPKVSPKKDSDKEVDLAEPTLLIKVHTYLAYAYLIARGVVLDVIRLAVGLLPWNRAAAAKQAAAAPGAASVAPKVGPTFLTGWATLPLPYP